MPIYRYEIVFKVDATQAEVELQLPYIIEGRWGQKISEILTRQYTLEEAQEELDKE